MPSLTLLNDVPRLFSEFEKISAINFTFSLTVITSFSLNFTGAATAGTYHSTKSKCMHFVSLLYISLSVHYSSLEEIVMFYLPLIKLNDHSDAKSEFPYQFSDELSVK